MKKWIIIGVIVIICAVLTILMYTNAFFLKKQPEEKARPVVEDPISKIKKALYSYKSEERKKAVSDLANVNKPEAPKLMIEALRDESSTVREEAIRALSKFNRNDVKAELRNLLKDPDIFIPVYAAESLAKLGDFSGKKVALKSLKIKDDNIIVSAINTISLSKDFTLIKKIKKFKYYKNKKISNLAKETVKILERIKKNINDYKKSWRWYMKEKKIKDATIDKNIANLKKIIEKYKDKGIDLSSALSELEKQEKLLKQK